MIRFFGNLFLGFLLILVPMLKLLFIRIWFVFRIHIVNIMVFIVLVQSFITISIYVYQIWCWVLVLFILNILVSYSFVALFLFLYTVYCLVLALKIWIGKESLRTLISQKNEPSQSYNHGQSNNYNCSQSNSMITTTHNLQSYHN